jgi:hypothetical protein
MKLAFVVIGLVCNSLGCYWTPPDDDIRYETQAACNEQVIAFKNRASLMYFDRACMVVSERKMTHKISEIYRKAAEVVGGMDTMQVEINARLRSGAPFATWTSRSYSFEEMAANRAYAAAASVLNCIADEFEKAEKMTAVGTIDHD